MKNRILALIGLVILLVAVVTITQGIRGTLPPPVNEPDPQEPVFCTMEAKMCPDGSYVGRTGPNCEFSACPVVSTTTPPSIAQETHLETKLGSGATGLGVKIVPLQVIEDSRCPVNVVCIQAGTVRLRTTVDNVGGTHDQIFTLNQPITTEDEIIELVSVTPAAYAGGEGIAPETYRFIFKISKSEIPQPI